MISLQKDFVEVGKQKLIENIQLLLYKTNEDIFERLDYENELIYQEPLLFTYFNSNTKNSRELETILYGYTAPELRPKQIEVLSDEFGRIYLPNIGWLTTSHKNCLYHLTTTQESILVLSSNDNPINYTFEPLAIIEGTTIELLKYPIPLLQQCYYDTALNLVDVEIENISKEHLYHLTNAWNIIRRILPEHYALITSVTSKCVVFNIDTTLRNSFATMAAQGIGFFNAYQESYNEVFFVDDIAHQTGHIIFNALIYEIEDFIQISPKTVIQEIVLANNTTETRDIHVLFHALYTYYTTFICLDACLENEIFIDNLKHEALGRIRFYIEKCYQDLLLIDNPLDKDENAKKVFTANGLIIFNEIKETFKKMAKKWHPLIKDLNVSNQPYNFTYSKFEELNPIHV